MSTEIMKSETAITNMSAFGSSDGFELAQRMAKMLASSQLVPQAYQGKVADCVLALEMANRIGASPLAVLQNMYLVYGKPAWSSQFLISCINASGKFTPLRYRMSGKEGADDRTCIAWAQDRTQEVLESPPVSIGMAKAEGWYSKNGSKWQTMPELMLRYRAATLFARLYAPELTMGIRTDDEVIDITPIVTDPVATNRDAGSEHVDDIKAAMSDTTPATDAETAVSEPEHVPTQNEIAAACGVTPTMLRDYCVAQGWTRGSFSGIDAGKRREMLSNAEGLKRDISAWVDSRDNQQ